jgi:hypothetical protein
MKQLLIISLLSMLSIKSERLNAQSFDVNRSYSAIPCTITYEILDTFLNVLFSETITNPPGPPPPSCHYGGSAKPLYVRITAPLSGNITIPLDGTPGILYLNCLPLPGNFSFSGSVIPTPSSPCTLQINLQL